MKKILLICILCGMMLVGCSEKSSSDNSKVTSTETTVTTLESTESTTVTTTKETTDTTTAVTTVATTTPDETTISAKEEVETEAEVINVAKQEENVAPAPAQPEKPAETVPPVVVPTPTPTLTQPAIATTAAPVSTKQLDANFKTELVAYIQDYCNSSGLVYRDDGNTPDNSSWDIPVRTTYCDSNEDIKSAVLGRARAVLVGYGQGTVINLYFEDDSQASGEWRIYVLV